MGLPVGIWFTYQRPHLSQKTDSLSSREHLQSVVTQLGIALTCYPHLMLGYCGLRFFRSCAYNHISFMLMMHWSCLTQTASPRSFPTSGSHSLSSLSSEIIPEFFRDGVTVPLLTLLLLSQSSMEMFCFLDENEQGDLRLESGSHIWASKPLGKCIKMEISEPCRTQLLNFWFSKSRETSYNKLLADHDVMI